MRYCPVRLLALVLEFVTSTGVPLVAVEEVVTYHPVEPSGKTTVSKALQFWNADLPILVKLDGKLILVSPLQPENTWFPMLVKLVHPPKFNSPVSPLQEKNA